MLMAAYVQQRLWVAPNSSQLGRVLFCHLENRPPGSMFARSSHGHVCNLSHGLQVKWECKLAQSEGALLQYRLLYMVVVSRLTLWRFNQSMPAINLAVHLTMESCMQCRHTSPCIGICCATGCGVSFAYDKHEQCFKVPLLCCFGFPRAAGTHHIHLCPYGECLQL